jgi:hypothetical protein
MIKYFYLFILVVYLGRISAIFLVSSIFALYFRLWINGTFSTNDPYNESKIHIKLDLNLNKKHCRQNQIPGHM